MLEISVDNSIIKPNTIWYHHQKSPRPGGHFYKIKVHLESDAVRLIEKMVKVSIEDADFIEKAKKENDNVYNLVQAVLDNLSAEDEKDWNVEWVFNSIDDVIIEGDDLIIKGECSAGLKKGE